MMYDSPNSLRARRLPAISAVAVIAAVVVAGVAGGFSDDDNSVVAGDGALQTVVTPPPAPVEVPEVLPEPTPTADASTAPVAPGAFAAVPAAARTTLSSPIKRGSSGSEVLRLQERLLELTFDPGPRDGEYGSYTIQAFWAFQKLVLGVPRDQVVDTVTDELWQRIQDEVHVTPRRPIGHRSRTSTNHTEIYLPEQVVVFFQSDTPVLIAHTSSGSEELWRETVTIDVGEEGNKDGTEPKQVGYMAYAHTPGGVFTYTRFRQGVHQSALGGMWDPAYFNFGIAIHGAKTVPTSPASHGCIRINQHLGRIFQQYIAKGDQVFVWNQDGDEPEDATNDYPWNQLDPDNPVNSTTTTTTTPPATSAAPATTQAPATNPPPPPPTPTPSPTPTPAPTTTTTTAPPAATAAPEPPVAEDSSSG